jgi:soluble lytic murein transglycosylase-like protein
MRLKSAILTLALGGIALTQSGFAGADIYKCMQADGTPLFTNVPEDPRCRLHLKLDKEPSAVSRIVEDRAARRYSPVDRGRYDDHVQAAAKAHGVDAALIHAVISAESGYNQFARSPKGARGLMQLIPETGARYGATNLLDPRQNIEAGTRYLKDLMGMFGNDVRLVLAAYNAGEGAVMRYGNIPPYEETRQYVPKVMAYYKRYSKPATAGVIHIRKTSTG